MQFSITDTLAKELKLKPAQINAFIKLYDDGATVPFIARYRKEQTQGLDDVQLRALEKRLTYVRDMQVRRAKITDLLQRQDKLTDELKQRIADAQSKLELEDIYLPYRPRRKSAEQKARNAGLEPIATKLLNEAITPTQALLDYTPTPTQDDDGTETPSAYPTEVEQLAGVQAIIMDEWSKDLALLDKLRLSFAKTAQIHTLLASEEKRTVGEKFSDYFDHKEYLAKLPDHRLLAMLRGRQENVLSIKIDGEDNPFIEQIICNFNIDAAQPDEKRTFLQEAATKLWTAKYRPHIEHRLLTEKRLAAEADAIDVFAQNLRHLLLASPAGSNVILGVDPGIRHGVKMAVIDANGAVVTQEVNVTLPTTAEKPTNPDNNKKTDVTTDDPVADNPKDANKEGDSQPNTGATTPSTDGNTNDDNKVITTTEITTAAATVYPFNPDNKLAEAKKTIAELITTYHVNLVAIGNGTASRETDNLVREVIAENNLTATAVMVNEAGASVYSASELASTELPHLDVSLRGAVSIARRLQDPLSELVKVDPKAIGVGQYQHDVNQNQLSDSLNKVTQDCVNAVGVDVNTASPAILAHIAGLNKNVAQQIVSYRNSNGAFTNREQLKNVPRLGTRTFEQAAGFLRIRDGEQPLDATGIHPESYAIVAKLLTETKQELDSVLGKTDVIKRFDAAKLAETLNIADAGEITLRDILAELAKPAHDPRPSFRTANFKEGVNGLDDLTPDMILEGVVTNVTNFGCFVDVGIHQDGLVHISQMSDDFVQDPLNVVKPGDIVSVRVLNIDNKRNRVGFSFKLNPNETKAKVETSKPAKTKTDKATGNKKGKGKPQTTTHKTNKKSNRQPEPKMGTLGALLAEAGLKKGGK